MDTCKAILKANVLKVFSSVMPTAGLPVQFLTSIGLSRQRDSAQDMRQMSKFEEEGRSLMSSLRIRVTRL